MPPFNFHQNARRFVDIGRDLGRGAYEKLPGGAMLPQHTRAAWMNVKNKQRFSLKKLIMCFVGIIACISLLAVGRHRHNLHKPQNAEQPGKTAYKWSHYPELRGFWNGVRMLVKPEDYVSEQDFIAGSTSPNAADNIKPKAPAPLNDKKEPPLDPVVFNPYPDYTSEAYLAHHDPVQPCYLDEETKTLPPNIYVYPGIPQNATAPFFGSYEQLGLNESVCYERFGRFGPYGYSYSRDEGGLDLSGKSEGAGGDKIWATEKKIDWRNMDWGKAQKTCYEKNKVRYTKNATAEAETGLKKYKRHAYILRTWTGYKYTDYQILTIRAMIAELALRSGGEYDVHFLLHVKDDSLPIWSSEEVYQKTIQDNLPKEFWGMATLWSEQQMKMYYPEPFPNNVYNHAKAPVHSVYRSAHFALQWFSQVHPEYDFYWNWEMDLRLSGHYYEFNTGIGEWAKRQPRKGIWERAARYYIQRLVGSWTNFTNTIEEEIFNSDEQPVWGPKKFENSGMLPTLPEVDPPTSYLGDNYQWGVGEDADLITFNPIFDPAKTNWVFRDDVTGYNLDMPEPPRRCAIITVSRLSKRMLDIMHRETFLMKHHMFPEMWPSTVAFHHGLKAVYAPHAVYFQNNWPLDSIDGVFNHPPKPTDSVFGWGEHNHLGNSFYYNAAFSAQWWRRWLGFVEKNEGGRAYEENGSGRLCMRPVLFHPVKHENPEFGP